MAARPKRPTFSGEKLSESTLDSLPSTVARFAYDRSSQRIGIVHFGIGAFHRAHQAWYTDLVMDAGERDWAISGVSLRSDAVATRLDPQDGLYTLTERGGTEVSTRLIGAIREVLVARRDGDTIVARIAAPECHIVSFTVTEKGYCRAADGTLDPILAEASFYPLLAEGLARRRAAALPGLTLLSCDNLAGNGRQLERLFGEYLAARRPELASWFARECTCPATMVDRIVPATTEGDIADLESRIGLRDEGAVFAERFSQWVIEDRFAGPRPQWEKHGARLAADVAPYETAKLRMLNGAHSALAYLGLEQGHTFVHEAIADPPLRALVDRLMRDEAATSFTPAPGQDLAAYADALLARFADPALNHRLMQIAMDGSEKIPPRWLEALAFHKRGGASCPALLQALSAWITHVRGDKRQVDDPMAARLAELWAEIGADGIAAALFGERGVFAPYWRADEEALATLTARLR
jgi:fructuronate reductase